MIVPSIDIQGGQTVQLVGGVEKALDAGDPRPIAKRFGLVGEIAVIDLDAAMGVGSNRDQIRELLPLARCRVGGGIRDAQTALDWLDAGAAKVILGTAARPELLRQLPKERVIAALDAVDGEVVVDGWATKTGRGIAECIEELKPHVGGFLITFVEREGRLAGTSLEQAARLTKLAAPAKVTIAGGVTTVAEVAALDAMGADAQVGMALYTGKMDLAEALTAPLHSDRPDGLIPTVVCDEQGIALGLAYSSPASLKAAIDRGRGVYQSRKRGLWVKGESSGAVQDLLRVDVDCDRDTLRFVVRQQGAGFCHLDSWTCFGEGRGLGALDRTIRGRLADAPAGSYTRRLFDDRELLAAKLREECEELIAAKTPAQAVWEAADLLYFGLVRAVAMGAGLAEIEAELDRRASVVRRRSSPSS